MDSETGKQIVKKVSSNIDKTYDSFFGTYTILPGQLVHLDGYSFILKNNEIQFIKDSLETKLISITFKSNKLRYYNSEVLPSMKFEITDIIYKNIDVNDPIRYVLNDILLIKEPSTLYISYQPVQKIYAVKNYNLATCFLMKKI